jgi:hypothetical protein
MEWKIFKQAWLLIKDLTSIGLNFFRRKFVLLRYQNIE